MSVSEEWIAAVAATIFIVAIGLVLPVIILWLRDRYNLLGICVEKGFGLIVFLFGASIVILFIFMTVVGNGPGLLQLIWGLFLFGAIAAYGWSWVRNGGPGIEHYFKPGPEFEELQASVNQARATLPWFIEQVEQNVDGAYIKFPLVSPDGYTEFVWAYVHNLHDGCFNVSIVNQPYDDELDVSGRRDVLVEEAVDWQIMYPDGSIRGAYSLIALFAYVERQGKRLSRTMRKQKAQLLDASARSADGAPKGCIRH